MNGNQILPARTFLSCLLTGLIIVLAPASVDAAVSDPFYRTSFAAPDTIAEWTITAGNWQFVNGEFVNGSAGAASIATVHSYELAQFGHDTIGGDFSLDVYALLSSGSADARVGVVFDFADAGNFHEVTVSATGNAQVRSRIAGVSSTRAAVTVAAPGANKWIHITLVRRNGRSSVWIDGVQVFANVLEGILQAGDVGLIARNTGARFDDLDVRSFGREDPYIEDFDDRDANNWKPFIGTWTTPATGLYRNTAVIPTAISEAPLNEMWESDAAPQLPYTFKVRVLNPYGGSGNLVGVAWWKNTSNYTEAVFSPTGQARLNRVSNGIRTTIANATYLGGERNRWFEIEVDYDGHAVDGKSRIKVNGVPVFDIAPNLSAGHLSLITHWSPASFDDVRASFHFFTPFSEDFDDSTAPQLQPDTWRIADGALNNATIAAASRAFVRSSAGWHELADIELRARMVNRFRGVGNLVGFTYGARGPLYYEAVFSPTGVAQLRKVVKNVPTTIATEQFAGGEPGQWFDAQLIQIDDHTTVKVNGVTVFDNVPQPDARGGNLGFVAHWTNASIDDVSLTQIQITRYRLSRLPDLTTRPDSQVRALNDLGEVVGWSSNANARPTAVLWKGGRAIDLGTNPSDGSAGNDINNKSEIVGEFFGSISFYWKEGQLENLSASLGPSSPRSEALGINERGQIVGRGCIEEVGCGAILWEPDRRVSLLEALPGGSEQSTAWAINERGEIVGEAATDAGASRRAVSWQGGTVEPLAGLSGTAFDVNTRGQIVGVVTIGYLRGALWQDRELIVLPRRVGENHVQAMAINEHGVIVGATTTGRPDDPMRPTGATVWQEGNVADLNELIVCDSLPESTSLVQAMDINERGEIAVQGFNPPTFGGRPFVLRPVSRRESCVQ